MLKYPSMRIQLQEILLRFSDVEYQTSTWLDADLNQYDNFDLASEGLLNDFIWDKEEPIGIFLRNDKELFACRKTVTLVEDLIRQHGEVHKDHIYLASPEWDDIVSSARNALRVLNEGDK